MNAWGHFAKLARRVLPVLIAIQIASVLILSFPNRPEGFQRLQWVLEPWIRALALYQHWGMFAPNVPHKNVRIEAEIQLRSGQILSYRFPSDEDLGYLERYSRERWRKFVIDNVQRRPTLQPYLAQFLARSYERQGVPVSEVRLIKRSAEIPKPIGPLEPARAELLLPRFELLYTEIVDSGVRSAP